MKEKGKQDKNNYRGICKEFVKYCYKHVDTLQWTYFLTGDGRYRYYRTKLDEGLELIVGFNLANQQYFFVVGRMGEIGSCKHRRWFPRRLQRLWRVLYLKENKMKRIKYK